MKQKKIFLFCNCRNCAFNSSLFRNIMIFYLNLFKAIKFALKVIDMNRQAPNLQLGLGTNYDVGSCTQQYFLFFQARAVPRNQIKDSSTHFLQCSVLIFLQLRLMANCRYNFLGHISFLSPTCKLGDSLFISITLRANLIALNRKSSYS